MTVRSPNLIQKAAY